MSAINFAKKYAGRRVNIEQNLLPSEIEVYPGYSYFATVVGYINDNVVVQLEEPAFHQYCWPLYDDVTLVVPQGYYSHSYPMVMAVNYKLLKEPRQRGLSVTKQQLDLKIEPPYPSVCKTCNAPARNNGRLTMCSNKACASRSKLLRQLDIKPLKIKVIRCTHKFNDKVCNKRAVGANRGLRDSYNYGDFWQFTCEADHIFKINTSALNVNDVVLWTLIGNNYSDRIWNGKKWDIY